jgi:hypothetical protein
MGLFDKLGVRGVVPLPQYLLGQRVNFLADQDEHFPGAWMDEFQRFLLSFKGLRLFFGELQHCFLLLRILATEKQENKPNWLTLTHTQGAGATELIDVDIGTISGAADRRSEFPARQIGYSPSTFNPATIPSPSCQTFCCIIVPCSSGTRCRRYGGMLQ